MMLSVCGQANTRRGRIIAGVNAGVNEWPWMAAIVDTRKAPMPGCGGALINANYVITAAHCFDSDENKPSFAILGEFNIGESVPIIL